MIKYRKDTDDIITLTLDMKGGAENIINHRISRVFEPVIHQLQKEVATNQIIGVIITSDKKNFLTGGDLEYIHQIDDAQTIFNYTEEIKGLYRQLEKLGIPVVAAINGNALGSGFELALACHHRVAIRKSAHSNRISRSSSGIDAECWGGDSFGLVEWFGKNVSNFDQWGNLPPNRSLKT